MPENRGEQASESARPMVLVGDEGRQKGVLAEGSGDDVSAFLYL
ncbi:hypothetical protein [Streptomyces mutabilis]